jgi:SpoVK/Ycf46/Vps4 family AAA+-type ATPase
MTGGPWHRRDVRALFGPFSDEARLHVQLGRRPDVAKRALAHAEGADLANLVNEAALLAARRKHEQVAMSDFSDSLEKIVRAETLDQPQAYAAAGLPVPEAGAPAAEPALTGAA